MRTPRRAAVITAASRVHSPPTVQGRAPVSGIGSRSRVVTRTARPDDLPAVLALVRQHRADAHAEDVLTGQTRLTPRRPASAGSWPTPATASSSPSCPDPTPSSAAPTARCAVGLAVLGTRPAVGRPGRTRRSPSTTFVVHREHRRRGAGRRCSWRRPPATRGRPAPAHVVAAVGGHEAERQRFFARMGFAPLTTRRIVALESLTRSLTAWQRSGSPCRCRAGRRPAVGRRSARCRRPRTPGAA